MVRRGEVRWVKFGKPDKRRPVVILTRDSHLEYLNEVTVAAVTSTIRNIPTQVILGRADGMPKDCAVSLDHIRSIHKSRLGGLIATLSEVKLRQIRRSALYALGF